EVGYGLIALVDDGQEGDLLERIRLLRKQAALELGILIPPIRIRDDMRLGATEYVIRRRGSEIARAEGLLRLRLARVSGARVATEYVIRLRGSEIARAEVFPRMLLALDTGGVVEAVEGMETKDPSFGMPARWIAPAQRGDAEAKGYAVVEPSMVLATHLIET